MLFGGDLEFRVESVMPHFLHVVPVLDDSVVNRVSEAENTAFLDSFLTDIYLVLVKTNHNAGHSGAADHT